MWIGFGAEMPTVLTSDRWCRRGSNWPSIDDDHDFGQNFALRAKTTGGFAPRTPLPDYPNLTNRHLLARPDLADTEYFLDDNDDDDDPGLG